MLNSVHHPAWAGFELTTLVMIGTDCTASCKSNYHAITTTTAPSTWLILQCILIHIILSVVWQWGSYFQLYHNQNKWRFGEMLMSALYKTNTLEWDYQSPFRWNIVLPGHIIVIRTKQSLPLHLNAACWEDQNSVRIVFFSSTYGYCNDIQIWNVNKLVRHTSTTKMMADILVLSVLYSFDLLIYP